MRVNRGHLAIGHARDPLLLDLTASGALRLVGGDQRPIDDAPPGERVTLHFDGVVDTALGDKQAVMAARVYPAAGPSGPLLIECRLRAVDRFDQTGVWSAWQPLRVDDAPPVVTLDAAVTGVFSGTLVRESAFTLVGDLPPSPQLLRALTR